MKCLLVAVVVLVALTACTVPPMSQKALSALHAAAEPIAVQAPPQDNETAPQIVVQPQVDLRELETVARGFADALGRFDTKALYPYLDKPLRDRVDLDQFASIMLYFTPKDRMTATFERLEQQDDGYVAIIHYGSDYVNWQRLEVPLVEQDGWHVQWFDNLTTRDGIIAACSAKLIKTPEDNPAIVAGRQLSVSSCMEAGAQALKDPTICPYATHDRERCYADLGITLTKEQKVQMCADSTGVSDNVTIANCLWDLARAESDVTICRDIATNRIERYYCLGELGALAHQPYQCQDAINEFTTRECVKKYIEIAQSSQDICRSDLSKYTTCGD